ncbi:MAG: hypothetical protein PUK76_10270 [Treponema sp.]|nr:hypothetical protein [Treponema sp.]MDY2924657.1 hypothetical protein [Treponema sp.]
MEISAENIENKSFEVSTATVYQSGFFFQQELTERKVYSVNAKINSA